MTWTVTFYSRKIEDDILALPAGFVARFVRYAERMQAFGPDLGMPHTPAMGGGLFELRLKSAGGLRECSLHNRGPANRGFAPVRQEDGPDPSTGSADRAAENEGLESCLAR